jgi:hypothetical protein
VSAFLDDLGRQLVERARQDAAGRRRSRRALALAFALLALIAVPAAAVTGVFDRASKSRRPSSAPGLVDLGGGCRQKSPPAGRTTSDPPPDELLSILGVLRRPRQPGDRVPQTRLGLDMVDGVNPGYVRRVRSSNGYSGYLIPALNVKFLAGGPRCPGQPAPPQIEPEAGVCIRSHSAGGCSPVSGIREGKSLLTEGGSTHGTTFAAGIVPDSVTAVIWRVRRGRGFLDTRIPVRDNVFIGRFPGRAGHGLYVYWVDASGSRRLVIGPHRFTPAERRRQARERALDRAAGPRPAIWPRAGSGHTLFELRMRVANPPLGEIYGVTVTGGMPGACGRRWVQRIGMSPAARGRDRGLMRAGFSRSGSDTPFCRGTYRGVVRKGRARSAPVIGTFSFRVR